MPAHHLLSTTIPPAKKMGNLWAAGVLGFAWD